MTPCSPQGGRRTAIRLLAALAGSAILFPVASASAAESAAYKRADASVVKAAKSVVACRKAASDKTNCSSQERALQRAGLKLSRLQHTVTARSSAAARAASTSTKAAPTLSAAGQTLSWTKVSGVSSYVLVRKIAGLQDRYSVVTATKTTPGAVAGKAASYAVRTAVVGSAWSRNVKITYPTAPTAPTAPTGGSTGSGSGSAAKPTDAPVMTVDGQTVRWNKVAGVDDYVYVVQIPGVTDVYHIVNGTSLTPSPAPGKTVKVGLRTNVDGSAWAKQVTISYPAATTTAPIGGSTGSTSPTTPAPTPTPAPAPAAPAPSTSASFKAGIVLGSNANWELPFAKQLGAKTARMEFDIDTPAADLASAVDAYAKAGIRPLLLAGFQGRTPTAAEGDNLATWAAAYGPNGTFWQGKSYPAGVAVANIEFGNETNQAWQYSSLASNPSWASTSTYANIARGYATAFKEAATKIQAVNPSVGLLAIGDAPGNWAQWMNNVYAAVPNFSDYVAGWTMHPYGPSSRWQPNMDTTLSILASHGAPASLPIYVTEYGIASDGGRCLDDNYGWDKCMTYDQAASALTGSVAAMRARYGSRLAALYLYQTHDQSNTGSSGSRESYFGGLTLSGGTKGAYTTALLSLLAA
jgi:hypothetical protein